MEATRPGIARSFFPFDEDIPLECPLPDVVKSSRHFVRHT